MYLSVYLFSYLCRLYNFRSQGHLQICCICVYTIYIYAYMYIFLYIYIFVYICCIYTPTILTEFKLFNDNLLRSVRFFKTKVANM